VVLTFKETNKYHSLLLMLHCHNLSVQLQQALVLHPLDLEIQRNERWVIIERNGSGKTSLLKVIANLLPFTGDVTFNQKSLSRIKHEDKAKLISYVPQHSNVDGRLTLQEYIRLTSSPPLPSQPFIETVTRALKIDTLLDKRLGQLSGGQKQRAHIARALCQQTKFMVLDEPLNHLDPCAQGEVLSLLILPYWNAAGLSPKVALKPCFLNSSFNPVLMWTSSMPPTHGL
jgi:iron complex transport system ATP-binding protein